MSNIHEILRNSDYSLTIFTETEIQWLENRIAVSEGKKGKEYKAVCIKYCSINSLYYFAPLRICNEKTSRWANRNNFRFSYLEKDSLLPLRCQSLHGQYRQSSQNQV